MGGCHLKRLPVPTRQRSSRKATTGELALMAAIGRFRQGDRAAGESRVGTCPKCGALTLDQEMCAAHGFTSHGRGPARDKKARKAYLEQWRAVMVTLMDPHFRGF